MQGIYKIRNKVNGKYYVGSTQNLEQGLVDRREWLRKNKHYNPHLQNAWNKYGEENFVLEIAEEIEGDNKALLFCEQVYLDEGFAKGVLYNISRTAGGGNLGEEVRQKQSEALTGREITWADKISKARKGQKVSEETKQKISETLTGHEVTEETRAKMSKARKGRKPSDETKDKISKTLTGRKHSEETKKKMRESWNGAENNAQPYPALFNEKTKELIPAGVNFSKMCREFQLSYDKLYEVKEGNTRCTRDGWRLA